MRTAYWEWRVFWRGEAPAVFSALAADDEREEEDVYLLSPACWHNVKLRDERVEVKRLRALRPGGFELWEDKETFPLPLSAPDVSRLLSLLGIRGRLPGGTAGRQALVSLLQDWEPRLQLVSVWKGRRRRALPDGSRLEVAQLSLPGGERFSSLCADAPALGSLQRLVPGLALPGGGLVAGYVAFLRQQVFWAERGTVVRFP